MNDQSDSESEVLAVERLHLSRLSNYSTESTNQINAQPPEIQLDPIDELDDSLGASNLSRIADHVVDGVLAKLTHEGNPHNFKNRFYHLFVVL